MQYDSYTQTICYIKQIMRTESIVYNGHSEKNAVMKFELGLLIYNRE